MSNNLIIEIISLVHISKNISSVVDLMKVLVTLNVIIYARTHIYISTHISQNFSTVPTLFVYITNTWLFFKRGPNIRNVNVMNLEGWANYGETRMPSASSKQQRVQCREERVLGRVIPQNNYYSDYIHRSDAQHKQNVWYASLWNSSGRQDIPNHVRQSTIEQRLLRG
jgi:hypothetical protein